MAGIFTFQDPSPGVSTTEPNFNQIRLPPPSQLPLNQNQNSPNFDDHPCRTDQEIDDLLITEDLLSDPNIWELCNDQNDLTGNSQTLVAAEQINPESNPVHSICACCQILREITHTNGMSVKRLEIHGAFGVITHAVLGIYDYSLSSQTQHCQMFDFHKESTQTVKNFLIHYYQVCRQQCYTPMQDPLSTFYEALSVGYNDPHSGNDIVRFEPEVAGGSNQVGLVKIPLAMQRERTRNLGLKDFVDYFDLPIGDAARRLNICPTVMKKICRKNGVLRWPYRKIKSIERKIDKAKKMLDSNTDGERARALDDIQKYKQQLENIYAEFR